MLDIFSGDAFRTVSLTRAFLATPYVPNLLGSLGIFEPEPIITDTAAIERLGDTLALVQTTPRGAPPASRTEDKRTLRDIRTVRVALRDRIYAHQVAGIRAFGQETALETMQGVAMRRMAKLRQDIELTWENLRMGCIKGVVKDADATTIVDYFSFFGISEPSAIDFDLVNADAEIRNKCDTVLRTIQKEAQGGFLPTSEVIGLCSDSFWDKLVTHPSVVKFYLNRDRADELMLGSAYSAFRFGGILFINYRGTDDGSTITIPAGDCRFVIRGGRDIFQWVMSPMNESMEWMNTMGQPVYAMTVPDRDRGMWVDVEAYSYPLPVCTRPRTLLRGTET